MLGLSAHSHIEGGNETLPPLSDGGISTSTLEARNFRTRYACELEGCCFGTPSGLRLVRIGEYIPLSLITFVVCSFPRGSVIPTPSGLQVVAVAHRHQAGFAFGEAVAWLFAPVSVLQRCAKFFAHLFAQHFRHFYAEIPMPQFCLAFLAAGCWTFASAGNAP